MSVSFAVWFGNGDAAGELATVGFADGFNQTIAAYSINGSILLKCLFNRG